MKQFLSFILVLSILAGYSFAQDKIGGNEPTSYFYSNGNGSTVNPQLTTQQPQEQQFSSEKQALLDQIKVARSNNDVITASRLQNRLNEMSGSDSRPFVNNPSETGILETVTNGNLQTPPFQTEGDYSVSTIQTGGDWGVATATSHRSTHIFAAVTEFVNGGGDLLKVYVSYNGGATWVFKFTYSGFAATVDCRASELDIEPVISGADTMLYVVAGYTFNAHALTLISRVNIGTGAGLTGAWVNGGSTGTNFNTYNPKVTSDNTNYTGATYVYMTVSIDSAVNVRFTTRFAVVLNPFTAGTVTYRNPNAGSGFWWQSNGSPLQYLHQDVCYFSSGGDRIYTVYNHAGAAQGQNIYIAWSNDYGVTNGGNFVFAETANVLGAICASNGGTGTTVLIGYRRLFSGADYDYRVQFSPTSGTTGTFTASYMEFTSDTTLQISMQGVDLGTGRFVTAYAMNGGQHYYRKFTTNTLGATLVTNNVQGDVNFGATRAGYWASSNPDSCVVVWSSGNGSNAYCSRAICTTVGVQETGNEIPNIYSLSQNYPNPFNPTTNIRFSIPNAGLVSLVVFDITGREVATLINQNMNAGIYTADFDATQLASGIYFYTIKAGSFTDTKKMVLVK